MERNSGDVIDLLDVDPVLCEERHQAFWIGNPKGNNVALVYTVVDERDSVLAQVFLELFEQGAVLLLDRFDANGVDLFKGCMELDRGLRIDRTDLKTLGAVLQGILLARTTLHAADADEGIAQLSHDLFVHVEESTTTASPQIFLAASHEDVDANLTKIKSADTDALHGVHDEKDSLLTADARKSIEVGDVAVVVLDPRDRNSFSFRGDRGNQLLKTLCIISVVDGSYNAAFLPSFDPWPKVRLVFVSLDKYLVTLIQGQRVTCHIHAVRGVRNEGHFARIAVEKLCGLICDAGDYRDLAFILKKYFRRLNLLVRFEKR